MNPLAIYQDRLNVVSAALLAGDFAAYLACIDLPYLLHTTEATLVLTTPDEMEVNFRSVHSGLAARGVTHYERVARDADLERPDRIVGQHVTNMIAGQDRIVAPHPARQVLVLRDGTWRFTEANYPFPTKAWPLPDATVFAPVKPDRIPEPFTATP